MNTLFPNECDSIVICTSWVAQIKLGLLKEVFSGLDFLTGLLVGFQETTAEDKALSECLEAQGKLVDVVVERVWCVKSGVQMDDKLI